MQVFLKTIAVVGLVIVWGSNHASPARFNLEQSSIEVRVVKKKNKSPKAFRKISIFKKLKRSYQEKDGSVAIFVLGMLLSTASLIAVLLGGGGGFLFGFFGALICFLAWRQSYDIQFFLVGVALGLVGSVLGLWQFFNSRD